MKAKKFSIWHMKEKLMTAAEALADDKTALALFSGAGGVMVFRVGCDKMTDDDNSVAGGIQSALNRYVNNC